MNISIHAPLTWRDKPDLSGIPVSLGFQSTRHLRGATDLTLERMEAHYISIHAPLTWRDSQMILTLLE